MATMAGSLGTLCSSQPTAEPFLVGLLPLKPPSIRSFAPAHLALSVTGGWPDVPGAPLGRAAAALSR